MANYDDDDLDEIESNDELIAENGEAAAASNRNFLLAMGILGALLLVGVLAIVLLFLNNRPGAQEAAFVLETNQAQETINAQTASAATQMAIELLTPSPTLIPTNTEVPPTPTRTSVVAIATATETLDPADPAFGQIFTATPSPDPGRTGTVPAALTQAVAQTRTQVVVLTATAARLPQSGFAEDVGLPGLFGLALGLVMVIVLVRRLRLSAN